MKDLTNRIDEEFAVTLTKSMEKMKLMTIGKFDQITSIVIKGKDIDSLEDFCYL